MGLFGGSKSIIGLDIGSSSVKAVELTRAGAGLVITGIGSAPIETPEGLGDAIQKVLKDAGITAKRCVSSVSGRSVIIRQVPMAQVPDSDLRQAIEYEADKYIPFDVNEVQLDVQRLKGEDGETPAGQMKVLLVAVKKTLVDEHIALLQSIGLKPVIIDVDVFALGNAFELRNLSLGIRDDEVRALIDIGASKTNINIMRGNTSFFQREFYVAGNDLTEAVAKRFGEDPKDVERMKKEPGGALESMQDAMLPVLEDIGNEIRLSFDYFENQYDQQVKEVYLSGGTAYFPGVDTMLTQIFNLPVKVWDPTEGLEISGVSPAGMGGANSDMAIALGLASRILSTLGWTAKSMPSSAVAGGSAVPDASVGVATLGEARALQVGESRRLWTKGIMIGLLASVVVSAGLVVANKVGYAKAWVIGEGLLIGLAAGIGIWSGAKALRPVPSRGAIVMAGFLVSTLACGALLGMRYMRGIPLKEALPTPAAIALPADVPIPGLSAELAEITQAYDAAQASKSRIDVFDITAIAYVFSHWILAWFAAQYLVYQKFKGVETSTSGRVFSAEGTGGSE